MADHQTIPVRRALNTLCALGITICVVMLVRWCVRELILGRPAGQDSAGQMVSPVIPAMVVHDLGKMIPPSCQLTVMGLPASTRERRMGMPYDVAEETSKAEAEAMGWELKDSSTLNDLLARFAGQNVYLTQDGAYVYRRLIPLKGGDTLLKEFTLPVQELTAGASEETTIGELETVRGSRVLNQIPSPLRETILGLPAMTFLMSRNGGHAFLVRAVSPMSVDSSRKELQARMATLPGWKLQERLEGAWQKENLSLIAEVRERIGSPGSEIVYRFTDDEVYLTRKGTQE